MLKKDSFFWPLATFVIVPVFSSVLAVSFLIAFITPLFYTIDVVSQIRRGTPVVGLIVDLVPFAVVTTLIVVHTWPVYGAWLANEDKSQMDDGIKRKFINAPVIISVASYLGWLTALVTINIVVLVLDLEADLWWYVMGGLLILINGALASMLIYYILDYINRYVYIEQLFPNGDMHELPGLLNVTIRSRFLIYFVSVGLLPAFILAASLYSVLGRADSPHAYIVLVLFFTFSAISLFLTLLIARTFHDPVDEIRSAAGRIQTGDLDARVTVLSTDEIGELGVGFNDMTAGLREKEKIKKDFGRAVDPRVRDYLLEHEGQLGGEERLATVLFCDIRGFTSLSENREPRAVVDLLNRYFERMHMSVDEFNGVVNKFIGDAVMALFGAPIPDEAHAEQAVRAGLDMLYRRDELNQELEREGLPRLVTGIGIHTGLVLAGNLGSASRMEYTVIGDAVNLASRLEGLCKKLNREFLISEATRAALPENLAKHFEYLARVRVKGKQEAVAVYGYHLAV